MTMTHRPLNVLICGYGAFGTLHAEAWRQRPNTHLWVADPNEVARASAGAFGIPKKNLAAEAVTLIDAVDVVDVVSPPRTHMALAVQAIAAGKPVLIEKPAVSNVEQAHVLAKRAEAAGLAVQIGFVLRGHPLTRRARQIMAQGGIGNLVAMEGDFRGWKRMRPDASILDNDGVHFLDLMRLFAGAPADRVDARAGRMLGGSVFDDERIELNFAKGISAYLRLGILATGEIEDSFVPGSITTKQLRLIGDQGNLVLDFNRNQLTHGSVRYVASAGVWEVKPLGLSLEHAFGVTPFRLLSDSFNVFLNAVWHGSEVLCSVREGAVDMAYLLAAIEWAVDAAPAPGVRLDREIT